MTIVTLKKGEGRSLKSGGMWIYDNEIDSIAGRFQNGGMVTVHDFDGYPMGKGFINQNSKIRVRMLTRNARQEMDREFLRMRIEDAWEYRKTVMAGDFNCFRLVFGEADRFPGLTVDKFGGVLVTQTLSLGVEKIKPLLFPLLAEALEQEGLRVSGIYERNDVRVRELEGLAQNIGWFPLPGRKAPEETTVEIEENGVRYLVDFANGQKTGFFLDQKYNRAAAARLAPGRRVLDCFTHTGSFGLNCAKAGAAYVRSVDVSETAIACARENCARNGLSRIVEYETANVFDLLPSLRPGEYDYIILDPPAFTKSGKTVDSAERGYKEINFRAMKALPRGGFLATCSCSHFMGDARFRAMLQSAARDAGVELRLIEARTQGPDHPVLWNVPETDYLKFYLLQIV